MKEVAANRRKVVDEFEFTTFTLARYDVGRFTSMGFGAED